jgi:hypothetical protein
MVFEAWHRQAASGLDIERATLIDFAAQHPRSLGALVPSEREVVRAHGLRKYDLSDLFAQRHFGTMRERFFSVVADLVSRGLLAEASSDEKADVMFFALTELGATVAARFSSPMAIGLRALCSVLCEEWRRRPVRDLANDIRKALPDESRLTESLTQPFAPWLSEVE